MSATKADTERSEKRAGLLLMAAAAAALLLANSPWAHDYHHLLETKLGPAMPRLGVMSLHQWIADGAMALFFLLVGLEVKREWYEGRLATPAQRRLPILAAAAGMAVPAIIYLVVTGFDPMLMRGWAIPAATDIAFAIGVLALLDRHAPASIKLLLVTIAIVDDIGAVIVIALVYTADLHVGALGAALALTAAMAAMGSFGVRRLWPFLVGAAILWLLVLASGVHPTIAGVMTALTIPLGKGEARSPLRTLEHRLHGIVMFGVVPLFGFAAAGVTLSDASVLAEPLPLAVLAGLFVGKQIGVFAACLGAVRSGLAPMPAGTSWRQLYGAAALCGIGFTMSLFIGALAFPGDAARIDAAKIGTLAGSLLSAIVGYALLRSAPTRPADRTDDADAAALFGADRAD